VEGNTVPVAEFACGPGKESVIVPLPLVSAPELLVVKPILYSDNSPVVAGLVLTLGLVTEVPDANAVLPRKGNIPNPAIRATATLARALLAERNLSLGLLMFSCLSTSL
jgi:hypothetical protein